MQNCVRNTSRSSGPAKKLSHRKTARREIAGRFSSCSNLKLGKNAAMLATVVSYFVVNYGPAEVLPVFVGGPGGVGW